MKKIVLLLTVLFACTVLAATSSAALVDQGRSIYDDEQGISFLEDANYAHTSEFVVMVPNPDPPPYSVESTAGGMTYPDALRFIRTLNSGSYMGIDEWRLPTLSEMQNIRNLEGVTQGDPEPFENVMPFYWVYNAGTADMIDGTYDIDHFMGANYRYVLPVHEGEEAWTTEYTFYRAYNPHLRRYFFSAEPLNNSKEFKWLGAPNADTKLILLSLNKSGFTSVPEPAMMLLLAVGLMGAAGLSMKIKR